MNNNKYKADLARIQHYYNDTKAAYGDYLQELISTPSCLDLKQESEDWGAQNMDDVEHAYQKSRKTCEFTIFLIDLLLKKSKEGGESDDSPFLNVLKEMRGYMHKIGELIISANKKFWGWDNEDGVVNILELINNTRKKCKDYAEILEKIEKGVDEMELGQSVVTSAPSNTGETNLSHEVRTLFALKTKGKDISDYWTITEDLWNQRELISANLTTRSMRIKRNMNYLRLNYVKKGQKCCAGNERHKKVMPHRVCNRDIQNMEPWRLSVSICLLGNVCQHDIIIDS